MKFWCISTEIDSCDSGCENQIIRTYYTNYKRAVRDFGRSLDEAADYGYGVSLIECEDVDGVIIHKSIIHKVKMYESFEEIERIKLINKEAQA